MGDSIHNADTMADLWAADDIGNPGAPPKLIAELESRLGIQLPKDYKNFMLTHNGHPETKKASERVLPLTDQSMLLNGYLLKSDWKEVILVSGPFPNSECINMVENPEVWKFVLTAQMQLLPIVVYPGENGTMFYRALECNNGTVLTLNINMPTKTVRITPIASDFRNWREMAGSDCAQM